MALTTVLLVASGLMARSLQHLGQVDLGLETGGVVAMVLHGSAWWDLSEDAALSQWQEVLDAVRSTPGVTSAGAMDYVPLGGDYSCDGIRRDDRPPPDAGEGRCGEVRVVLPGTLETLGIPLVRGRHVSRADGPDVAPVAVIDESLADALWPEEDPIGKRMHVHVNVHEVVGVVADMRHFGPARSSNPTVYLHAPQEGWNGITRGLSVLLRTDGEPETVTGAVRASIATVNPDIATGAVTTLERLERLTLAGPRFRALLLSVFAGSALALSILGIAGVMAYSVAMRMKEMGVRVALGARPRDVRAMVLGEGVRLTTLGVGVGLVLALAVVGYLDSLLFEVRGRDPFIYGAVVALLTVSGVASCYVPARRASGIEPAKVLTAE
jgi:putative ABC transport system permease protein